MQSELSCFIIYNEYKLATPPLSSIKKADTINIEANEQIHIFKLI